MFCYDIMFKMCQFKSCLFAIKGHEYIITFSRSEEGKNTSISVGAKNSAHLY